MSPHLVLDSYTRAERVKRLPPMSWGSRVWPCRCTRRGTEQRRQGSCVARVSVAPVEAEQRQQAKRLPDAGGSLSLVVPVQQEMRPSPVRSVQAGRRVRIVGVGGVEHTHCDRGRPGPALHRTLVPDEGGSIVAVRREHGHEELEQQPTPGYRG